MKFCTIFSLFGVFSVSEVVRHRRLRWFGHLECLIGDDWVSVCRNVVVVVRGRGRKTSRECVNDKTAQIAI